MIDSRSVVASTTSGGWIWRCTTNGGFWPARGPLLHRLSGASRGPGLRSGGRYRVRGVRSLHRDPRRFQHGL